MKRELKSPKFAKVILSLFLRGKENSEKLGDLEEGFRIKTNKGGNSKAKLWYWGQVITTIPVSIKNSITWGGIMFKNYFIIAIRNIRKYKAYSAINILGLAVGIACCIFILLWVQDELSYETFHENGKNIFRITTTWEGKTGSSSPWGIIPILKNNFPEVAHISRYVNREMRIRYNNNLYNEKIAFVDPEFLEMFTFPLISGDKKTTLQVQNSIVLSERSAIKYFGNENPIGKTIKVNDYFDLQVTGIMKNVPENSHILFDFIANVSLIFSEQRMVTWEINNPAYVMLYPEVNYKEFEKKISGLMNQYYTQSNVEFILGLQPITQIHLYGLNGNDPVDNVYLFSLVAVVVLLIACINFMNLLTARSAKRNKEIGMRKVIGAERKDIVKQFFGESIILSFFSLFIAIVIVMTFMPAFNNLIGKNLSVNILDSPDLFIELITITLVTGIISGIYPAILISSFQPAEIFKSKTSKVTKGLFLRRGLIIFQFTATVILVISTIAILLQMNFIYGKDHGYKRDNIVVINMDNDLMNNFYAIKQALLQNADIINISRTSNLPFHTDNNRNEVAWEGKSALDISISWVCVDYDYFETFGMKMQQGRTFSPEHPTDKNDMIINEAALKLTGYKAPIGKMFSVWENVGKIIGVVKDFNGSSLLSEIQPAVFLMAYDSNKNIMAINISTSNTQKTIDEIKNVIHSFAPDSFINYRFMDEEFNQVYTSELNLQKLLKYFTLLAILISSIGLLGLASFSAQQRTKEIAVRKVFGAKTSSIIAHLSREYLALISISNLVGLPLTYLLVESWLQKYAYHTMVGFALYLGAAIFITLIAFISVSYQTIKAAKANPVKSLKYE